MEPFRVKVKRNEVTYLWGGPNIRTDVVRYLTVPLLFTMRVDDLGEEIEFGYQEVLPGQQDSFGRLRPGESYTVSLERLTAIWAKAEHDSNVDCQFIVPVVNAS